MTKPLTRPSQQNTHKHRHTPYPKISRPHLQNHTAVWPALIGQLLSLSDDLFFGSEVNKFVFIEQAAAMMIGAVLSIMPIRRLHKFTKAYKQKQTNLIVGKL